MDVYYYPQDNAYDVIQRNIESSFHSYIGKKPEEIENIVIVGAYHGYEINRLLWNYPKANIYAFEAHPAHFDKLQWKYLMKPRVKPINKAVCDTVGSIEFHELGNGGAGSGSLLKFTGHEFGHPFVPLAPITVSATTLREELGEMNIDLLWVDVQGAELMVLKGCDLSRVDSLFLETKTRDYVKEWDKEPYKGMCFLEDLQECLADSHIMHSIGLDNANGNGQGNSFWIRK